MSKRRKRTLPEGRKGKYKTAVDIKEFSKPCRPIDIQFKEEVLLLETLKTRDGPCALRERKKISYKEN